LLVEQMERQQAAPQVPGYGVPQFDQTNPMLNAAAMASQYSQNAMTAAPQQRPAFPQLPVVNGQTPTFGELAKTVPPSELYKLIDGMAQQGTLRGSQVVF